MYFGGGNNSDFWERHPRAALVFWIFLGGLAIVFAVGTARAGRFRSGKNLITRDDNPLEFWFPIALAAVAGLAVIGLAIRQYFRRPPA